MSVDYYGDDDLRDTDAQIAERVFGWRWCKSPGGTPNRFYLRDPEEWQELAPGIAKWLDELPSDAVRCIGRFVPRFTSDANDDYDVLCFVRNNWAGKRVSVFYGSLQRIWEIRSCGSSQMTAARYEKGDYGRAAILAIESCGKAFSGNQHRK